MVAPDNSISSAPKEFSVLGLRTLDEEEPVELGTFTYQDSNKPVQTFKLSSPASPSDHGPFDLIELKVLSNHGNHVYTCLYRFRVHGKLIEVK